MKKIALLLVFAIAFVSCNDDDDNTPQNVPVTIKFSQNWDGTNVSLSDFGTTEFTNAHGNVQTITKLRYLISKIIFTNSFGDAVAVDAYNLVDLTDESTLTLNQNIVLPPGTYTKISFVYGFNEEDNISAEYLDLNAASWNWPEMLGGGYHFLQLEGNFNNDLDEQQGYAYHNGTARVSEGVFEQNFITVTVDDLSFSSSSTIDIKMNIAEWFKNPYTWDLNVHNNMLMGNYDAQILMNDNGQNVFDVSVD